MSRTKKKPGTIGLLFRGTKIGQRVGIDVSIISGTASRLKVAASVSFAGVAIGLYDQESSHSCLDS